MNSAIESHSALLHDLVLSWQTTKGAVWLLAFFIVVLTFWWQHVRSTRRARPQTAFPFLKLPLEIRESIYERLVDLDPSYPKIQPEKNLWLSLSDGLTQLYINGESQVLRSRGLQRFRRQVFRTVTSWLPNTSSHLTQAMTAARRTAWQYAFRSKAPLLFVNRQIHEEYVSVLCRRSSFKLYIQDNNQADKPLWALSAQEAEQVRRCEVKLIVTPGMTGSFDPRVAPSDWALGDRAVAEMQRFKRLEHMTLQVHACGNQIWNPAWLWHYTSQSFKKSQLGGFRRITFHLKAEGWLAGENYMQRNSGGGWDWHCSKGHFIRHDKHGTMPIRKFCAALYDDCHECTPNLVEEE